VKIIDDIKKNALLFVKNMSNEDFGIKEKR
jgi:hypothetical protein